MSRRQMIRIINGKVEYASWKEKNKMRLNTLYTILAVIAFGYGAVAVLLPGFLIRLLWLNPAGPEGYLLLQGWGSCLIAFSVIAWGGRRLDSGQARRIISLGFFTYFV